MASLGTDDRARFDKLLASVLAEIPNVEGDPANNPRSQLEARLRKEYDEPKIKELGFCLQKSVSPDEARQLIFFPDTVQIQSYVYLIVDPPEGAPKTHPQRVLQVLFVSMLYLVHSKNWSLMTSFIRSGGLRPLSGLLAHENVYIRSQSIDLMLKVTSSPDIDWFETPSEKLTTELHQRLLELSQWGLAKNLLANAPEMSLADGLPVGSSYFCLQILAFYLSWMRKLYTKDGVLNLSKEILNSLKVWSTTCKIDEETELATKVYEDFVRFPAANDIAGHNVRPSDVAETGETESGNKDTPVDSRPPTERANEAKLLGNAHFKKQEYLEASRCYEEAIKLDGTRAAFHANLAAVWLQLASKEAPSLPDGVEGSEAKESLAQRCIASCKKALDRDPTYTKAFYRYAQALNMLGDKDGALKKCKETLSVIQVEVASNPPKSVLKELDRLKGSTQKLQRSITEDVDKMLQQSNGWNTSSRDGGKKESKKVNKIAAALMRRKGAGSLT